VVNPSPGVVFTLRWRFGDRWLGPGGGDARQISGSGHSGWAALESRNGTGPFACWPSAISDECDHELLRARDLLDVIYSLSGIATFYPSEPLSAPPRLLAQCSRTATGFSGIKRPRGGEILQPSVLRWQHAQARGRGCHVTRTTRCLIFPSGRRGECHTWTCGCVVTGPTMPRQTHVCQGMTRARSANRRLLVRQLSTRQIELKCDWDRFASS